MSPVIASHKVSPPLARLCLYYNHKIKLDFFINSMCLNDFISYTIILFAYHYLHQQLADLEGQKTLAMPFLTYKVKELFYKMFKAVITY